jgi:hypothetical protein
MGAGIAALGFWLFIAAAVIGGIWEGIRKREESHKTLRQLLESQPHADDKLIAVVQKLVEEEQSRPDRDFLVAAFWLIPVAIGLAGLAYFVSMNEPDARAPMIGVATLVGCIGVGALIASYVFKKLDGRE